MSVSSIFREAGQALRFNRRRSILTTSSLAWGVACFVILYSYGEGFHLALRTAFLERGVGPHPDVRRPDLDAGGRRARRPQVRVERTDVDAIREAVPMVAAISPEMMMGGMTVVRGYRSQTTMVRAVNVAYGRIRNQSHGDGPVAGARG